MRVVKFTILLSIVLLLFACKQEKKYLIPQEEMINILVDIHIADGVLNTVSFPYDNVQLRPENYYKNVLLKHKITRLEFDSALSQYTQDRELYIKMYDKVIEKLRTKESFVQGEEKGVRERKDDMKFFYYSFNTDYETSNGLSRKVQKGLSIKRSKSGKQSYKVVNEVYVEAYNHIQDIPLQRIEFQVSFDVFFETIPEKLPSVLFALQKDNKFLSHQYIKFDKFVSSAGSWHKIDVKVELTLKNPESEVEISSYIFNKKKTPFFLDNYSITIKQLK